MVNQRWPRWLSCSSRRGLHLPLVPCYVTLFIICPPSAVATSPTLHTWNPLSFHPVTGTSAETLSSALIFYLSLLAPRCLPTGPSYRSSVSMSERDSQLAVGSRWSLFQQGLYSQPLTAFNGCLCWRAGGSKCSRLCHQWLS